MFIQTPYQVLQKANEAIRATAGKIDESLTISAWRQRAQITRNALLTIKEENERKVAEITDEYSPKAAAPKVQAIRSDWSDVVKLGKKRMEDDLDRVIAAKRAAVQNSMNPPSEAQLRTLQAMQMRSSIPAEEFGMVASQMSGSVQALGVLHDIAKHHGVDFPEVSVAAENKKIDEAEAYCHRMIETADASDLGYIGRVFWLTDSLDASTGPINGIDGGITAALAEVPGYVENESSPTTTFPPIGMSDIRFGDFPERAYLNRFLLVNTGHPDANVTRVRLRGDETLSGLSVQFMTAADDVKVMNPDVDFDKPFKAGTIITVPSTSLFVSGAPNSVTPDQCAPGVEPLD